MINEADYNGDGDISVDKSIRKQTKSSVNHRVDSYDLFFTSYKRGELILKKLEFETEKEAEDKMLELH